MIESRSGQPAGSGDCGAAEVLLSTCFTNLLQLPARSLKNLGVFSIEITFNRS
jgi:hypothetical protein